MRTSLKRNHREAGVALIVALLVLVILSVLAASIMLVTQTETWSAANSRSMLQARYAAEAGAQKTLNWLNYIYVAPANLAAFDQTKYPIQLTAGGGPVILSAMSGVAGTYPDAAQQSAFSAALKDAPVPGMGVPASYEVTAKLLSIRGAGVQAWEITSQGNVPNIRNAQVQVVMRVEKSGTPIFAYGIFATANTCGSIDMSGNAYTDSFDSSAGTYARTVQATGGDVATNGNLVLSGSANIGGTLSSPQSGTGSCSAGSMTAVTESGSGGVTGAIVPMSTVALPAPPPPSPVPPKTPMPISGNCGAVPGCTVLATKQVALAPGQYGDLLASASTTVHLRAGTYNVNNLVLSGGSSIIVDSGPVIINVEGAGVAQAIDFSGGTITNSSSVPENFQVYYGGSHTVTLSGSSGSYGVVYAPNAPMTMSGAPDWFGAVVALTLTNSGGGPIHYDRALQNTLLTGDQFYPISFTWSKF